MSFEKRELELSASGTVDEAVKRRQSFDRALENVCERFPQVAERVRRSLETPQIGFYHNEGPTMEAHLRKVLAALEDVAAGRFPKALAGLPEICQLLKEGATLPEPDQSEAQRLNPEMVDYVFFHDIAKPDCLTLGFEDGTKEEISWEQWRAVASGEKPFKKGEKSITSVSYYHDSKGDVGHHGNTGADQLAGQLGISADLLVAMRRHEIAYQFPKISAGAYEEHFVRPGFTEAQQRFILLASFIDTSGSLRENGSPDYTNFIALAQSRLNFRRLQQFIESGARFSQHGLSELRRRDTPITDADIEKIIIRQKQYDLGRLEAGLQSLIASGQFSLVEVSEIVEAARTGKAEELGRRFQKRNALLKPILAGAEKR